MQGNGQRWIDFLRIIVWIFLCIGVIGGAIGGSLMGDGIGFLVVFAISVIVTLISTAVMMVFLDIALNISNMSQDVGNIKDRLQLNWIFQFRYSPVKVGQPSIRFKRGR